MITTEIQRKKNKTVCNVFVPHFLRIYLDQHSAFFLCVKQVQLKIAFLLHINRNKIIFGSKIASGIVWSDLQQTCNSNNDSLRFVTNCASIFLNFVYSQLLSHEAISFVAAIFFRIRFFKFHLKVLRCVTNYIDFYHLTFRSNIKVRLTRLQFLYNSIKLLHEPEWCFDGWNEEKHLNKKHEVNEKTLANQEEHCAQFLQWMSHILRAIVVHEIRQMIYRSSIHSLLLNTKCR